MIDLRIANLCDIDGIMEIEKQSFLPQICEEKKVFEERINFFNKGFLVFVDEDKNICGYICTELWKKFDYKKDSLDDEKKLELKNQLLVGHSIKKTHCDYGKNLYISSFAIGQKLRGRGLGKKLFSESMDFFEKEFDLEKKFLLVNEDWKGAQKIYSDYGFEKICCLPKMFYKDEQNFSDGVVMVE